jgi:CBS domain-containing protein
MPRQQALALTVGDVMIAHPETYGADIDVGQVRRVFERPSQRLVLLVDGPAFRGAIDRAAVDPGAPDSTPAESVATCEVPMVTPTTPIADALELLERSREPRLVVLDADGTTLRGLLCFSRGSASFCLE